MPELNLDPFPEFDPAAIAARIRRPRVSRLPPKMQARIERLREQVAADPLYQRREREVTTTAFHEAGHAVAALAFGWRVLRIEIALELHEETIPFDDRQRCRGLCRTIGGPGDDSLDRRPTLELRRYGILKLAGVAAEALYTGEPVRDPQWLDAERSQRAAEVLARRSRRRPDEVLEELKADASRLVTEREHEVRAIAARLVVLPDGAGLDERDLLAIVAKANRKPAP
jgi:hypothetical protein